MKTRLELLFKGDRNYLHGTDIFNQTLMFLEEKYAPLNLSNIDFSFHHLAKAPLDLYECAQDDLGHPVAVCAYRVDGTKFKVFLYESSDVVEGRYAYNEDEIARDFTVDKQILSGVLAEKVSYTDMETWVALTKVLHQNALVELKGKWLFVRGRFPEFVLRSHSATWNLKIVSNFQNTLTRTELRFGEQLVGEIYFSII